MFLWLLVIDRDLGVKILLSCLNVVIFWVLFRSLFQVIAKNKKQQSNEVPLPASTCCLGESANSQECCSFRFASPLSPPSANHLFEASSSSLLPPSQDIKIFYATQTGTAKKFALSLADSLNARQRGNFFNGTTTSSSSIPNAVKVLAINDYDTEDFYSESAICLFILSTYTGGSPTDDCNWFFHWLEDAFFDFRVSRDAFHRMKFGVFGLGHSDYGQDYLKVAKVILHRLTKLGAVKIVPLGEGDARGDQEAAFSKWTSQVIESIASGSFSAIQEAVQYESSSDEDQNDGNASSDEKNLADVEDLGKIAESLQQAKNQRSQDRKKSLAKVQIGDERHAPSEMVTPMLKAALSKQGYKIVGTHSGVKICRWTKAMLRGRGGCYKHTFYGIASHQCMETTPSLACANKCVFCWRHHTNPVGTEWRWTMDDPEVIVAGAMENHYQMLKQLKGVPGVDAARFAEAQQIRHCALSLVGEPIMYPKINEFLGILHSKKISSFLVTNAQFPERIDQLVPVTQLYLSIDASTKDSLKTIDRPLFKDFWERFLACLRALAAKRQRTVYRLTLVKAYNVDEVDNYAQLVAIGKPSFIEVKGVTFCGYSGANPLTMSNVPFHREVVDFCEALAEHPLLGDYEIACEHEHSCSVLLAHKQFKIDGIWHTWIDYEKFHELVSSGTPFTATDYMAITPSWAVAGSKERGFDPEETRFHRKKPVQHGC